MTVHWNRLGPREKQVLAILRQAETTLTTRDVLSRLREEDVDIAYTTVGTLLDRLVEKGFVRRGEEVHQGSLRYRHEFPVEELSRSIVDRIVDEVQTVLGETGVRALIESGRERSTINLNETKHDT